MFLGEKGWTRVGLGTVLALALVWALAACASEKQVEVPVPQTVLVPQTVEVPVTVTPGPTAPPAPTATPQPTATPVPGLDELVVAVDMVRGHTDPTGPTCALNSIYQRGEMVVWRMRVADPATGKYLPEDPKVLLAKSPPPDSDASEALAAGIDAEVHLGDGQVGAMHFHPHSGSNPTDYFWTWSWVIPEDYPTGSLDYYITVDWAAAGKTGRWDPPNVSSSRLTVSERVSGDLILSADMVRGHSNPQGPTCALTSQYQQGEMVVWRMKMVDPSSGDEVPANASDLLALSAPPTAEEITAMTEGITATVHIADGQQFPMHFGAHSGSNPVDYFWTTSWEIPTDYPTGVVDYYITVDWPDQEKTGRWDPPAVGASKLTITTGP